MGYGDGVRRALTNDADLLVGGRRVPLVGTVSMDNVTVDLGPGDAAGGRRAGRPARPPGRRARARGGVGAAARHDPLRGHVRDQRPRAAGAPPVKAPIDVARDVFAGAGGVDRRRRRARPAARPRDRRPRPRRARATRRRAARAVARAGGRRRLPALGRVRRLARRRPGGRLARRPRHAARRRHPSPTSPRATSPSTRWPSRSPAARCSTRTAAAPTSRRGGCGW